MLRTNFFHLIFIVYCLNKDDSLAEIIISKKEEMVISFHEDNVRGIAKTNDLIKNNTNALVPVFADSIGSYDEETGKCNIHFI